MDLIESGNRGVQEVEGVPCYVIVDHAPYTQYMLVIYPKPGVCRPAQPVPSTLLKRKHVEYDSLFRFSEGRKERSEHCVICMVGKVVVLLVVE